MGYLTLPLGTANFSKAVISFWFNVPQAAIAAAGTQWTSSGVIDDPADGGDFNLAGMIPLVVFGAHGTITFDNGGGSQSSPSFIGLNCGPVGGFSGEPDGTANMYARLQYLSGSPPTGLTHMPDFFQMGALSIPYAFFSGPAVPPPQFITIAPGVWHHALVSFDVTSGCSSSAAGSNISISSSAKFWWAIDDVNYSGTYLFPASPASYGSPGGDNDIVSNWCLAVDSNGATVTPNSASFGAGSLPTNEQPIAMPSNQSDFVYGLRMAKLQFFTGVSIDTSIEANRRAFVGGDGKPADPALAAALLGRSPIVEFRKANDWITGVNRGTAGNFTRTGTIAAYSPGPD